MRRQIAYMQPNKNNLSSQTVLVLVKIALPRRQTPEAKCHALYMLKIVISARITFGAYDEYND